MKKIKVAINGFGRIGRAFLRVALESENLQITQINDVGDFERLAYLLEFDSTLGNLNKSVEFLGDKMLVNGEMIKLSNAKSPKECEFGEVDVVIESSGKFLEAESLNAYLKNGAKKVILSAPPKNTQDSINEVPIFVLGVNEAVYNGEKIISNASCSSNAIAPIIRTIHENFKILGGNITTIHPFNSDQNLLDSPHKDTRLSRNATLNIIPTSSSIGEVLGVLFSTLRGKFYGDSIRVPTSLVSLSNIDLLLENKVSKSEILGLDFGEQIGFDCKYRVSSDFVGEKKSGIIAKDLVRVNGNLCRISVWFDNESGYANRLVDMVKFVCK